MRVILIGFAACYKTSVGRILAQKFNLQFCDTDLQVEEALGASVAHVFETQGEDAFRRAESNVLQTLVNATGIISCGGGAVLSANFPIFAQDAVVVWLQASSRTVSDRLCGGTRPLFDALSEEELHKQMEKRFPLYQKYATFSLSTDGKTSQAVADEVAQKLAELKIL